MGIGKILAIGLGAYFLVPNLFSGDSVTAGNIFKFSPGESIQPTDAIVSESASTTVYESPEGVTSYVPHYTQQGMEQRGVPLDVQNAVGLVLGEIVSGLSSRDLTEAQIAILVSAGIIAPAPHGVMQGLVNVPGYIPGAPGLPTILMH